jgi:CheY-like chemotaxis protein
VTRTFAFALGVGFLAALLGQVPAQDKGPPKKDKDGGKGREEYSEFGRKPESVEDYWHAVQFELDVGRHELAARALRGLLDRKPTDDELVKLEERDGMPAFLRLRTIPKWSDDPKVNEQAIKNADELADRVAGALQRVLGDPKRINRLIKLLTGDREERAFAARELYRAKAAAVPPLVTALREGSGEDREAVLSLLPRLARETVPPLIAALDIPDPDLRVDLIDVLLKRGESDAVPWLWYYAGSPKQPERVRRKATEALATLLKRPAGSLPAAVVGLTREAERYYNHKVIFTNPAKVVVWRWDGKALVTGWPNAPTVPATQAEEYYGLHFARQALDIDPTYTPAQQVFLALALEKGIERTGLDRPLAKGAPDVQKLLATVNPTLIIRVLDQALSENRLPVILGAVRALGDLEETRANLPGARGEPALVRAMNYPDRRVQMAAAEALLRIPARPSPTTSARVLDVLRRAAGVEPEAKAPPRVLIGFADDTLNDRAGQALQEAGYEAVKVRSGRQALQRLAEAADIDALLIATDLPDPGLAPLVGQLRGDPGTGRLPLWLVLPGDTQDTVLQERRRLDQDLSNFRTRRRGLVELRARKEHDLLTEKNVGNAAVLRQEIERIDKELATTYADERENALLARRKQVEQELLTAPRDRTGSLRRLAEHYDNVWLMPGVVARDPALLKPELAAAFENTAPPLSEAERKDYAERALRWLARIARGEVPGYDVVPAADALYKALHATGLSEQAVIAAIEATGRLPGTRPQNELARVVLDAKRPVGVRSAAAAELLRNIQEHAPALTAAQRQALETLAAARDTDAGLRERVELLIGATRPDARLTGERLKGFEPRPAPPPKEK